jgi:gliding motility-associated-like protein
VGTGTITGTGNSISLNATSSGNLSVTATNTCGTSSARNLSIVVDYLAPVNLGGDQAICLGSTVNLSVPNNAVYTYLWSDGGITNNFSTTPIANETVWVRVTNSIGCIVTDTINITVNSITPVVANVDFYTVVSTKLGTIDVQANDAQIGIITIINAPLNGLATVNTNGDIEYTSYLDFTGQDVLSYEICDAFCSGTCDTAYVYIKVEKNVFDNPDNGNIGMWGVSPNQDGINDILYIDALYSHPNNKLTIYNRWGDEIFTSSPYLNDWDGTDFTDGHYFFVVEFLDSDELFKGIIYLKK